MRNACVDTILQRMIFDGEQLTDLMEPFGLGWRERRERELALMADLVPLLNKRAHGRDISGLNAYEHGGGAVTAKTPTPLVPKLRFPEFVERGPWVAKPLDDLCDRLTETVGDSQLTPVSISAGKGFVPQAEKFGRDISGSQYSKYIWLRRGDLAYNRGNSKRFPQGCVYQLTEFDEAAASNAFHCFRLHDSFEPAFVLGFFEDNGHGRQLIRHITSGARSNGLLNISTDTFLGISIPVPPTATEQKKIADCLGSLDDLIAAEGRKLEALRQHKQGLMAQLFPQGDEFVPRLRFPEFEGAPEWSEDRLGNLVSIMSGKSPSQYVLASEGDFAFVKVEDLNNCTKYQASAREYCIGSQNAVPSRSLLFPKRGAAIANNKIRITASELLIDTNLMALAPHNAASTEFLYYYLAHVGLAQIADTSTIPQINNKHIIPYRVLVPPEPEQQRIAACLSSLDDLLDAQSGRVMALNVHKQGLLQQLFPRLEEEAQ